LKVIKSLRKEKNMNIITTIKPEDCKAHFKILLVEDRK